MESYCREKYIKINQKSLKPGVGLLITKPGKYVVIEDLNWDEEVNAITVTSSNVSINFCNKTITTKGRDISCIKVYNKERKIKEFTLSNCSMKGTKLPKTTNSIGLSITNVETALVKNCKIKYSTYGISVDSSNRIKIFNTNVKNQIPSPLSQNNQALLSKCIYLHKSSYVLIRKCYCKIDDNYVGTQGTKGLRIEESCHVIVYNCIFKTPSSVMVFSGNNVSFNKCKFYCNEKLCYYIVQIGSPEVVKEKENGISPGVRDVEILNSKFRLYVTEKTKIGGMNLRVLNCTNLTLKNLELSSSTITNGHSISIGNSFEDNDSNKILVSNVDMENINIRVGRDDPMIIYHDVTNLNQNNINIVSTYDSI